MRGCPGVCVTPKISDWRPRWVPNSASCGPMTTEYISGTASSSYLGSRYLPHALRDRRFLDQAFETPRPGKELLIALVLQSRAPKPRGWPRPTVWRSGRPVLGRLTWNPTDGDERAVRHRLRSPGDEKGPVKILEMYAAALEIDGNAERPDHLRLMAEVAGRWIPLSETAAEPNRVVDEAKLGLVWRFSDAAALIAKRPDHADRRRDRLRPAYPALYDIGSAESSYLVRLAAAQVIGEGENEAVTSLSRPGSRIPDAGNAKDVAEYEGQLRGWLAPVLYYSCRHDPSASPPELYVAEAGERLQQWLDVLAQQNTKPPPISSEIALAQGFKLAANRRDLRDPGHARQRAALIEKAEFALAHARFWYSQLALIQALTLLSLPDDPAAALPARGPGSDPAALAEYWLEIAGSGLAGSGLAAAGGGRPAGQHPFVTETGQLCVLALRDRRPERFCWIDESQSVRRVGSYSTSRSSQRTQPRWIPNSVGWTVLHPRAQRLLADVLLMLNLAERGDRLHQVEERLQRADRPDLPPCLTTDRKPLDPQRTIASAQISEPGSNCIADCRFRLCPYPPRGTTLQRAELSESFCRSQLSLLGSRHDTSARAPWQALPNRDLGTFWRQMAERELPAARTRA